MQGAARDKGNTNTPGASATGLITTRDPVHHAPPPADREASMYKGGVHTPEEDEAGRNQSANEARDADSNLWHLAGSAMDAKLTDYEFAMMAANNGFERFVSQVTRLAGPPELTFTEAVLVHVIRMHETPKDTATIARFLNRDDLPNIQYAVRKLVSAGLVNRRKVGVSTVYEVSDEGREWTDRYAHIRQRVLLDLISRQPDFADTLEQASYSMFLMAGLMDASFRRAAAFNTESFFFDDNGDTHTPQ